MVAKFKKKGKCTGKMIGIIGKLKKNNGKICGKFVIIIENMVAKLKNLKNVTENRWQNWKISKI